MPSLRIKPALLTIGLLIVLPAAFLGLKAAEGVLERRHPPPGRMISVGTHSLHLYCFGKGGPAVVIEPGMGCDWVSWRAVAVKAAESQQVCVYDRAGYGWSDPGPMPRTARRIAAELHELLSKGGVPAPYILIGHSFGGHIARAYAAQFPASLKGVILAEPTDENETESPKKAIPKQAGLAISLPPLGWARMKRMFKGEAGLPPDLKNAPRAFQNRYLIWSPIKQLDAEKNEGASLPESSREARSDAFPPHVPLIVITATPGADPRIHVAMQQRLARLSPVGRQVVADSKGHFVYSESPELVLNAIHDISSR